MREDDSPMPADGHRATVVATKRVTFPKRSRIKKQNRQICNATTDAPISSDRSRYAASRRHGALPQQTKRHLRYTA